MSLFSILLLLLIAAICGGIGQSISGYSLGGCVVSIVVGFIGAYIGQWIADEYHLPEFFVLTISGREFPVVWAIIGSTLFSIVIGMLTRGRKSQQ